MRWPSLLATLLPAAAAAATTQRMEATAAADRALSLRVLTFNIRYAAAASTYERPWSVRGPLVIKTVAAAAAAAAAANASAVVIGMQEVLDAQLQDIAAGLGEAGGEGWAHLGTGRDDGARAGEYCPLFYQPGRLALLGGAARQLWLSPTPDVPSYWPGAGSRRYVLAAAFEDRATGRRFVAANTHLDNVSGEARVAGVGIALGLVRELQAAWGGGEEGGTGLPAVLTGDFNSEPGDGAYEAVLADGLLADAYAAAADAARFGPYETYTGFVPDQIPQVASRIDFVWLGPNGTDTWDLARYEVVDNVVDGVFMSDHRPVFVDISLKG